ncbi:Hypothetical predicted protein [Podarcis lilfordi]|uniref:BED-type domain-containing protein n=1 Tax=Podarcis lilfordi TaxID=74358 RepID=A0AA35PCJ9_9SAUR|nr:Hypothetical predicted protein [Podarcis lilfordi]
MANCNPHLPNATRGKPVAGYTAGRLQATQEAPAPFSISTEVGWPPVLFDRRRSQNRRLPGVDEFSLFPPHPPPLAPFSSIARALGPKSRAIGFARSLYKPAEGALAPFAPFPLLGWLEVCSSKSKSLEILPTRPSIKCSEDQASGVSCTRVPRLNSNSNMERFFSLASTSKKQDLVEDDKEEVDEERSRKYRKQDESYFYFGFISVNNEEHPQCVLCLKILPIECMLPCKMKHHLESVYKNDVGKPMEYFSRKLSQVKESVFNKQVTILE